MVRCPACSCSKESPERCLPPTPVCRPGPPVVTLTRLPDGFYLDITPPAQGAGARLPAGQCQQGALQPGRSGSDRHATPCLPPPPSARQYCSLECSACICHPIRTHAVLARPLTYTLVGHPDGGATAQRPRIVITGTGSLVPTGQAGAGSSNLGQQPGRRGGTAPTQVRVGPGQQARRLLLISSACQVLYSCLFLLSSQPQNSSSKMHLGCRRGRLPSC